MKYDFRGWYELQPKEINDLWEGGLFVLDTNVLLDLYRLTPSSRQSLLDAIEGVRDQLWLPHQVGLEFHKMRRAVRRDATKRHQQIAQQVVTDAEKIIKSVTELTSYNPVLDADRSLREALREAATSLAADVRATQSEYVENGDPVLDRLEALFPGEKVGAPFSASEDAEARADGKIRFENEIPPGFADGGKSEALMYGDFFIWRQLINFAKGVGRGVVFVTGDAKPDWWGGKDALPELLDEFYRETGQLLLLMKPKTFIDEAGRRGRAPKKSDDDLEQISDDYERAGKLGLPSATLGRDVAEVFRNSLKHIDWAAISKHAYNPRIDVDAVRILGQALATALARNVETIDETDGTSPEDDADDDDEQKALEE